MRIVSVHLKNIKSHRDSEFSFSPGINVLSGVNGSGKSTIFEAVGYALFGVNAQDFVSRAERFLTIGAKKGEVAVVFEPCDGERYRVSRTVGPSAKWLLAKETGGLFEVEEHANAEETEKRIASLLGLSENRPLADQFKLVIGPFQNDFLGPFVIKQPTKRQAAFDEILGIDAWRKTFDGTKSLAGAIQGKMDTLQAEISGKLEQVAVLPGKEVELRGLREALAVKEKDLEQRQKELDAVTTRLAVLDAQKERIEAVQSELQGVEGKIGSGKEYVSNQQLLVEQSNAAAAVVAAARLGKQAYDAAEQRLKELREQEKQKLLLEKKLTDLEKEQSTIRAALAVESRELDELRKSLELETKRVAEEEGALDHELAGLKKTQADAELVLARATAAHSAFAGLPVHNIENVLPYLFSALDRMSAIDAQAAERQKLLEGCAALEAEATRVADRQRELEKIQGERSELSGRKQSLIEGRKKIGAGDCPYFHEPCRNMEAGGGVEIFTSRIEQLDAEMERLDAAAKELAGKVASALAAAQRLAGLEQVRRELAKSAQERAAVEQDFSRNFSQIDPDKLVAAVDGWLDSSALADAYGLKLREGLKGVRLDLAGNPQERRALLSQWSDGWRGIILQIQETLEAGVAEAQAPVQASRVKLAELNTRRQGVDARKREVASSGEKAVQREKTVAAYQARLKTALADGETQEAALAAFAGLDDAIKAAGEELERHQGDRDRYIAHQKAAEELEKRQETLSRYQSRLQDLEAQLAAKREELANLVAGYSPEDHDMARAERDRLMSSVATLKAEINSVSVDIKRLEGEIAVLAAVAVEIEKKRKAIEELKDRAALVKFLRNQVFKNVSAQLSERFREEISSRADRIYRSISDSDEELLWGENYQIVLKDMADGAIRERTDDQLSGGQMMSAVVALRLALLQTIGARIAFFDEPTSNLDAERRENLAKAFRSIDVGKEEVTEHWYDQLFLVSHDVSFTEITDQMIHLD